jgi:hypothetical protein
MRQGAAGARENARCQPARSRVPANWVLSMKRGSDDDAVCDAHGRVWRPDVGAAVRLVKLGQKEKSPRAVCGAGFMISLDGATVPVICPTGQMRIR